MHAMAESISLILLGLVEGLTEFIPVSSTGHLIIARQALGIVDAHALAIDAVLQLATSCALLVYFWRDVVRLLQTFFNWVARRSVDAGEARLLIGIIVGTIPAVVLGLLLESYMESVFRSVTLVAAALVAGSVVMVLAEYATRRMSTINLSSITWGQGLVVGLFQSIALIPGMSRSGMTIAGGMLLGFTRSDAARFGFLLSLPVLFGSGLKKLYELEAGGLLSSMGAPLFLGAVVAFLSGLAAIHFLMLVVRKTPLTYFAVYRVLLAALLLVWF